MNGVMRPTVVLRSQSQDVLAELGLRETRARAFKPGTDLLNCRAVKDPVAIADRHFSFHRRGELCSPPHDIKRDEFYDPISLYYFLSHLSPRD
ncbi:hypothetical protein [Bradyrhizobium sp.]|uniref:hypothetical protein n=1 Tax=Bradyrhizobium sp. TaxID=376 RepID=UPI002621D17D|nr:hypothetical protein [Bradyrhizobium sp.]